MSKYIAVLMSASVAATHDRYRAHVLRDRTGAYELLPGKDNYPMTLVACRTLIEKLVAAETPSYRCAKCGGINVSHAMWVSLNDNEPGEQFGSWCHGDNSFCDDCQEHTHIAEVSK